jgi:hypothetical protein
MLLDPTLADKGLSDDTAGIMVTVTTQILDYHFRVRKGVLDQLFYFGCRHWHEALSS